MLNDKTVQNSDSHQDQSDKIGNKQGYVIKWQYNFGQKHLWNHLSNLKPRENGFRNLLFWFPNNVLGFSQNKIFWKELCNLELVIGSHMENWAHLWRVKVTSVKSCTLSALPVTLLMTYSSVQPQQRNLWWLANVKWVYRHAGSSVRLY